jgi:platelet-activating factor acetylhydrolase IB subunit alpha
MVSTRRRVIHRFGKCIFSSLLTIQAGHDNWVRALVFHPGGKYLLSAADDKTIRCWDLEQAGRCIRTIDEAHSHFVTCLRWAPSTPQLVGSSETNGTSKKDGQGNKTNGIRCVVASGGVDLEVKIWMP